MGAWGYKSFENDAALDWLDCFKDRCNIGYLKETFDKVLQNNDYIEVDEGAAVIASAEFIAMLKGNRPFGEKADFSGIKFSYLLSKINDSLIEKAIEAIKKIKNVEISEVAALREDSKNFEDWLQDVNDIEAKLILPKQAFIKPKLRKRKQPDYYSKNYPSVSAPTQKTSIWIVENGTDKENADTYFFVSFGLINLLVFSAKGTDLNIQAEWKDDNNIIFTLDNSLVILSQESQIKVFDVIKIKYIVL